MKSFFNKKRGQAMAEFVLIIPVILLIFTGIVQFTLIMQDYIKLGMLEREVMMFCSTAESNNRWNKKDAFAKQYAAAIGLNPAQITVTDLTSGVIKDFEHTLGVVGKVMNKVGLTYVVEFMYGADIRIQYKTRLISPYKQMLGSDTMNMETTLHTGRGNVFAMQVDIINIFNALLKDAKKTVVWLKNIIVDFFRRLF